MSHSNPLLFERSKLPYESETFASPTVEYRGAPFWSWNARLEKQELLDQLDYMRTKMGMGGAHIHPRTGLDTDYMGDEYMDLIQSCVDHCKENGMLAYLYDEDRWPSGAAGGMVSKKNPDHRQGHLLVTKFPYGALPPHLKVTNPTKGQTQRSENGKLLACFDIRIDDDGLARYTRIDEGAASNNPNAVFFYYEWQPPEPWWNYGTYVDTLNPEAIRSFIEMTHEKYRSRFGEDFGTIIPSIFTDEPQFTRKEHLKKSSEMRDLFLPWTHDLETTYTGAYGQSLIDHLPELLWDVSSEASLVRYRFHDHIAERFTVSYMDQISAWCSKAGLSLTGHVNGEPRLATQTEFLGEAMRCYRNQTIPGVDILCDDREYNTVKQAVSVARQRGVKGVFSELYGVTNWTFDFKGHKAQGDWQAALGVTFRVPHLFPYSIAGEAKRDYPAAIGYQAPWTTEYAFMEEHFARVNTILTRGTPVTRVAVIHPIESFWLAWGPADRHGNEQVWREHAFADLTEWLLHGLVDFDFISESLFQEQTRMEDIGSSLPVGECRYDVVIVPNLRTIRRTTVERLQRFIQMGGIVIITGEAPSLIDAKASAVDLAAKHVPFTRKDIIGGLEDYRDIRVTNKGVDSHDLFYQLRRDGDDRFLFLCDTARWDPAQTEVRLRGDWELTVLDTLTGREWGLKAALDNGWTVFRWQFHNASSLLLRMRPQQHKLPVMNGDLHAEQQDYEDGYNHLGKVRLQRVELSEPNVLLLDQAEWRLNSGPWQAKEEILKIDNIVRAKLEMPLKKDAFPQPWTYSSSEREPVARLDLRLEFKTNAQLASVRLAVENIANTTVSLDGTNVDRTPKGWFVDKGIPIIDLGSIAPGTHRLDLTVNFGIMTPLERIYLLGDFSGRLYGDHCILDKLNLEDLSFGDLTHQGLPFYTGNVTYRCSFSLDTATDIILQTYKFAGPAVTCEFRGQKYNLALPPHIADIGHLESGTYDVKFSLYGNRENAFGAIHMPPDETDWWNPNSFRGDQNYWMDEYGVKPMGITATPVVRAAGPRTHTVPIRRRHVEQAGISNKKP